MTEEWLERQEGPDGQYCELLTRIPYDRYRIMENGFWGVENTKAQNDVVFRAMIWEASVKDTLTGEMTDDVGKADAMLIDRWRDRAVQLYNKWNAAAMPGPKGSSRTDSRTPTSGRKPKASETSESETFAATSPGEP